MDKKMKTIKSLDQIEKIVLSNKSLFWDGWDIIEIIKSDTAWSSKFGFFKNNSWHIKKVFSPSREGWKIPDKYVV